MPSASQLRSWLGPLGFALVVVGGFNATLESWRDRVPVGHHMAGSYQGDMPTYLCFARMAGRTPTGLHYASPHDVREPGTAWLVNLPISVLGWMMSAGVAADQVDSAARFVFGVLMLLVLAGYLRTVFKDPWLFWAAFVVVGVGSGYAWVLAWGELPPDIEGAAARWDRLRAGIRGVETHYYWWYLDVFRNLIHSLELIYHCLVFGLMWALATQRLKLTLVLLALGCLSHPFVGIQMCGLAAPTLVLLGRRGRWATAGALSIASAFIVYYAVFLPSDPAIASLQQQHQQALSVPLRPEDMLVAYGVALVGPVFLLLRPQLWRRLIAHHWPVIPAVVLFFWTLLLAHHSRLPTEHRLMPMHFTRGYIHAAAWVVTLVLLHRWVAPRRWRAALPAARALAIVLALSTLPDAAAFLHGRYEELPQREHLVWTDDTEEILGWLRTLPDDQHVLVENEGLGKLVCAFTEHRSAFGTPLTTPHHFERRSQIDPFLRRPAAPPPLVHWSDVVVDRRRTVDWLVGRGWERGPCNGRWCAARRGPSAPPRSPARSSIPD